MQELRANILSCSRCSLRAGCSSPVPGHGPSTASIMIVGEAPGFNEDQIGVPFCGDAGTELENYLRLAGVRKDQCYISNAVKCRPVDNADPEPLQINACREHLNNEILAIQPKIILALGRFAARWFLGEDLDMDTANGMPHEWVFGLADGDRLDTIVVPAFHPAYGLHFPAAIPDIAFAFENLRRIVNGELTPVVDQYPNPVYGEIESRSMAMSMLDPISHGGVNDYFAIDTETGSKDECWCLTISHRPGAGFLIRKGTEAFEFVKEMAESPKNTFIFHHSMHDIGVLRRAWGSRSVFPKFEDTMQQAFCLQREPMGLKALAARWAGMKMLPYEWIVNAASDRIAQEYLMEVLEKAAPDSAAYKRVARRFIDMLAGRDLFVDAATAALYCGKFKSKNEETAIKTKARAFAKWAFESRPSMKLNMTAAPKWAEAEDLVKAVAMSAEFVGQDWIAAADFYKDTQAPCKEEMATLLGRECRAAYLDDLYNDESQPEEMEWSVKYPCKDADATFRVWEKLDVEIDRMGLREAYELDLSMIPCARDMEDAGMMTDPDTFSGLEVICELEVAALDDQLHAFSPSTDFNSPDQVAVFLYDELKLPIPAMTKSKKRGSTDDAALSALEDLHPSIELLQERRRFEGCKTRVILPCKKKAIESADGRVRGRIKVANTETGRFAMEDPNLLGMPKRWAFGESIRQGFVAGPGRSLVGADYSQIEIRLLAIMSRDEAMLDIYRRGLDQHSIVACSEAVLDIEIDFVQEPNGKWRMVSEFDRSNPEHELARTCAKTINFGIPYGMSAPGLLKKLRTIGVKGDMVDDKTIVGWETNDRGRKVPLFLGIQKCRAFIEGWRQKFPTANKWLDKQSAEARRSGVVRNWAGRYRRVHQAMCATRKHIRESGERFAYNAPIQSGAVDIMKKAMGPAKELCDQFRATAIPASTFWKQADLAHKTAKATQAALMRNPFCEPLLQFHDALYFEVDDVILEDFIVLLKIIMESCVQFEIEIPVEVEVGKTWGTMKKRK